MVSEETNVECGILDRKGKKGKLQGFVSFLITYYGGKPAAKPGTFCV
jgi:hypothetical protein